MKFNEAMMKVKDDFQRYLYGVQFEEKLKRDLECPDGEHCPPRTWGGAPTHSHWKKELTPWNILLDETATQVTSALGRLIYYPIEIPFTMTISHGICVHRDTAAGNMYMAMYDANMTTTPPSPRNRLAVSASVACTGTNRRQNVAFTTPVQVTPQLVFVVHEVDNALDEYVYLTWPERSMSPIGIDGLFPFYQALGAYLVPPAVAAAAQTVHRTDMFALGLLVASVP